MASQCSESWEQSKRCAAFELNLTEPNLYKSSIRSNDRIEYGVKRPLRWVIDRGRRLDVGTVRSEVWGAALGYDSRRHVSQLPGQDSNLEKQDQNLL
jgi:hypothetical protein